MPKLQRFNVENQPYHVSSATRGRAPIFADEDNAAILIKAFQFSRRNKKALVLAYCVMPDHFHALIVPKADETISSVMQSIKGYVARRVNQQQGTRGQVWQQSFFDRAIRDERHLDTVIAYINANPVKEGLAAEESGYRFSSAYSGATTDIETFFSSCRRGWKASTTKGANHLRKELPAGG